MQQDRQETEVRETTTAQDGNTVVHQQAVTHRKKMSNIVLAQRVLWFIVGVINVIITLRFVLLLLGANREAGFTDFVYSVSAPFVAPFVGIFGEPTYGRVVFEVSSILAIIIYTLVAWGIVKLLTIARPHEEV
ncbi:MAG: hypothetical protein WBP12_02890 [Candidatus Saccharimonas sp.]